MNNAFSTRWCANSEVISQVLFTSEHRAEHKTQKLIIFLLIVTDTVACGAIYSTWYKLKQIFTLVSVNSGGYLLRRSVNIHHYSPPPQWIIIYDIKSIFKHYNNNFVIVPCTPSGRYSVLHYLLPELVWRSRFVSLISKVREQCGLKASWQPQVRLDSQIEFSILKSCELSELN